MIDPYVYEGTDVLINKFNINDNDTLQMVEKEFTTVRIKEILGDTKLINGRYDYEHLKAFHHYIFQDVYEWAGSQRTIDIEKSEIVLNGIDFKYSSIENIEKEITNNLEKFTKTNWGKLNLDERVSKFTYLLSNVWKSHAFREGNTRTAIIFFVKALGNLNIPLKHEILTDNSDYLRKALVAASYEDKEIGINRNFTYLNRIIKDSFESFEQKSLYRKTLKDIQNDMNKHRTNKHDNINNDKALDKER